MKLANRKVKPKKNICQSFKKVLILRNWNINYIINDLELSMLNTLFSTIILLISPVVFSQISPPHVDTHLFSHPCINQEKPVLTLYYTTYCPHSQKVLNYLQQIHKTVPMKSVDKNSEGKAELLRVGGRLQVPCLVVDGKAIYESDVIICWLSQHQDILDPA
jgi:glutaredoxin 3